MQINIPIFLTLIRIVALPFFIFIFYLPFSWAKIVYTIIFILFTITDWLDGFLARRWKQITKFGTFLDPVADKMITIIALILIIEQSCSYWITLPSKIIILREIIILALREWMAEIGKRKNISVSWIGKVKTTVQMISITILLYKSKNLLIFGVFFLYIALILSFFSMLKYFYIAKNDLIKKIVNNKKI